MMVPVVVGMTKTMLNIFSLFLMFAIVLVPIRHIIILVGMTSLSSITTIYQSCRSNPLVMVASVKAAVVMKAVPELVLLPYLISSSNSMMIISVVTR